MRASGLSGELRVGYQQAARLGAWTILQERRLPLAYVLRAKVIAAHDYWMTQQPLDLRLQLSGRTDWLWRDVRVERSGDEIALELHERPIVDDHAYAPPPALGRQQKRE